MPRVEIYTKSTCGYCRRAKALLDMKKIPYEEIAVDFGGPDKQKMVDRSGGRMTVPQIFIGDRHVGGCDDLMSLEQAGKLDPMLAE
jgi:glutaredoxin 3